MNHLKTLWIISIFTTAFSVLGVFYSLTTGYILDSLYLMPVMILSYPITVIGFLVYGVKKVLQEKSLFELLQMAGKDSGVGSFMDFGGENKDEDGEQETGEDG